MSSTTRAHSLLHSNRKRSGSVSSAAVLGSRARYSRPAGSRPADSASTRPTSGKGVVVRSAIAIAAMAIRGAQGSVQVAKSPASPAAIASSRSRDPAAGRSSRSQIANRPSAS